ncbi:hypothetical protein F7R01_00675 [Pseudomonas argentinensis]|uniref:Uncharacterized protein n=1 Tax=Phytopseudomonas argentinensis TaxID=289370 RepID=A0A1I3NWL8_9GAMM|nr:hypothetical protein [Pseudomonas argentinensis]KAB0549771.1 hypothetical protein F7R01_00675 [Pseudomonas argentinensis]SFJ13176.1 hypothetical protein SAMN05216602_4042 [Pseudomonas argentinensis]
MPQSQQERDAKAEAKRKALGEEELRHRVRPGTKAKLAELMAWHGITEQAEAVQLLILNAHALGPEASATALALPRHEIQLSENVARRFIEESERELRRDPGG